jgi:nucleoside-diphosphate-sugar epimerase
MTKILMIGCGSLGTRIAESLYHQGHEVVGVRASRKQLPHGMRTLQADVTQIATLSKLVTEMPEVIVYCIAATAQTDENYNQHYVQGLKNVISTQSQNTRLQHVFFISSTRVYGQVTDAVLDETVSPEPSDFGGSRLLEAEQLLHQLPCQTTALRLSGIYGLGRLYLINMAKDLARWPLTNSWTNRIHEDDASSFIAYLVQKSIHRQVLERCYIVTDNQPVSQYEVLNWLASKMGLSTANHIPEITQGKRLSNARLQSTGYQLRYPDYKQGYLTLL